MPRIKELLCLLLLFCGTGLQAQGIFIIEGDTLKLTTEVRGEISLFWNDDPEDPRFFVRKADRMVELRDRLDQGVYHYRNALGEITADQGLSADEVNFDHSSFANFVRRYNQLAQEEQGSIETEKVFAARLGFFTGLTNSVYSENPENVLTPLAGIEFEMFNPRFSDRHSVVLELEQTFKRDNYRYTATQFSVNYRFRFLQVNRFEVYVEASLLRLLYARDEREVLSEVGEMLALRDESEFKLQAPLSVGLGADLQVTENGYITFGYNEVVSVTLDTNGSFPVDVSIGYKYNL